MLGRLNPAIIAPAVTFKRKITTAFRYIRKFNGHRLSMLCVGVGKLVMLKGLMMGLGG